jgi:hypothetical protein
LPWALRGGFALDTATTTPTDDDFTVMSARVLASMPLSSHVFFDARLPLGVTISRSTTASVGNPSLGIRGVVELGSDTWVNVSGAIGLPLLSGSAQRATGAAPMVPAAVWDLHDYMPSLLPLEFRVGLEKRIDFVSIRAEIAPILMMPVGRSDEVEVAFLHAAEIEAGRVVSAGLRLQGVALPTTKNLAYSSPAEGTPYQAAMEPFVVVRHGAYFARSGLMLPLDEPLGPPLTTSFGFRLALGVRFE